MSDPYSLLGVSKKASDQEIKTAYRRLAKKYHPDVNGNDPKIAEKFQKISAAYDILSDKEKRQQYDAGQIDGDGNPINPFAGGFRGGSSRSGNPFSEGGFDFKSGGAGFSAEDIFSSIFGGGMGGRAGTQYRAQAQADQPKGADRSYTLKIGFIEAALGAEKKLTLAGGKSVTLKIPPGTDNHDKLRLKGKGDPGYAGSPAGDALIEILVASHPSYQRDGLTIRLDLPITVYEAALGGKITVPTLYGSLSLKIPAGSQSGHVLRLKGKGIQKGGQQGDQLVRLLIMLPENLDEKFKKSLEDLEVHGSYNPRKNL